MIYIKTFSFFFENLSEDLIHKLLPLTVTCVIEHVTTSGDFYFLLLEIYKMKIVKVFLPLTGFSLSFITNLMSSSLLKSSLERKLKLCTY